MKKIKNIIFMLMLALMVTACSTAPITGRKQLKLVSDESVVQSSVAQYNQMIGQLKTQNLLANNTEEGRRLVEIGKRVTGAVEEYLRENKFIKPSENVEKLKEEGKIDFSKEYRSLEKETEAWMEGVK